MDTPPTFETGPGPDGDLPPPPPSLPGPPPPPPAEPPLLEPPRKSGLAFFGVVLALYAILGTLAQAASPVPGLVWSEVFALLLPAFVAASGANLAPSRALRLALPRKSSALLLAIPIGAAGFLAAGSLMELTSAILPARWLQMFDMSRLFDRPPVERVALAVAAATVAPVCEEIAFRGWILTALRTAHGTAVSILLCAVLFAVMHLDPVRFTALVGLGLLYGWLTWRSGSVWPAVLAHATNNGIGVVLTTSAGAGASTTARPLTSALALGAALTFALGCALLRALAIPYRAATPSPPAPAEALAPRDAGDLSSRFRLGRVAPSLRAAAAAAVVALACLLALRRR